MRKREREPVPRVRVRKKQQIIKQPLDTLKWMSRESLNPNDYNPNHVAPVELDLLRLSMLSDGWTQPIVATPDGKIIDGYHRWTLSAEPEIANMTGGKVPVVVLNKESQDDLRASTIRHNRARGTHAVLRMAEIVRDLIDIHKLTKEAVMIRLGMEEEELDRLYDFSGMTSRGSNDKLGLGWVPDG